MRRDLQTALEHALGERVALARRVRGGDINEAFAVRLASGAEVFVKANPRADPRMFDCEARGLRWLAEAGALRVPEVRAVSDPGEPGPAFLVLELLASGSRSPDYDARLGRGLARLHRAGSDGFGLSYDNFIADLQQDNRPCPTWAEFYLTRRLVPQLRRAIDGGRAPRAWLSRLDRLSTRLQDLVGPPEPPSRLHGDLWSGNVLVDEHGAPCLIDPAVYGGCREVDLAMLRLFGHPGGRFWEAYDEVYPRTPGEPDRVALYQLFPLLVHTNLFGGSYVDAVDTVLDRYA